MTDRRPVLDYLTPPPAPCKMLTLEEGDGGARVIFPVQPMWAYISSVACPLSLGAMQIVYGILFVRLIWSMCYGQGTPSAVVADMARRMIFQTSANSVISALALWLVAAYQWRMHRRWGQVPRVLTANSEGMMFTRLGWWRMRERRWPASEIAAIELRPVRGNLNWKRTEAWLYIHRHQGPRLRFRLSSSDSQLPDRIALRLASVIGCPQRG